VISPSKDCVDTKLITKYNKDQVSGTGNYMTAVRLSLNTNMQLSKGLYKN
jgi:hypothetical protein